jgi:hypothetical protein
MFGWFKGDVRLSKRVASLEEELATLRREHKEAVLEAAQLYEQARRILGRLNKRAPDPDPVPEAPPAPRDVPAALSAPDPVSARILQFRRNKRTFPGAR